MGWKPNQGTGRRITKQEKRERRKKAEKLQSYGCTLPYDLAGKSQQQSGSDSDESDDDATQLFAPDDIPSFIVQPKENTFGLGYSGLVPRGKTALSQSPFVLFEPTLSLTDKRKKLQIAGQAFGVGAFEDEDEDIYAKDDMSRYDFELGGKKEKTVPSKMLALPSSDVLDGFVRAKKAERLMKTFPLPDLPRDFVPIHRNRKSRFDIQPKSEHEHKGLGRHDLNAFQRAKILNEVLELDVQYSATSIVTAAQSTLGRNETKRPVATVVEPKAAAETFLQQLKMVQSIAAATAAAAAAKKSSEQAAPVVKVDHEKNKKIAALRKFVDGCNVSLSFQPFSKDPEKQFRFHAFNVLSKFGRMDEYPLLLPDSMIGWERDREKVFE